MHRKQGFRFFLFSPRTDVDLLPLRIRSLPVIPLTGTKSLELEYNLPSLVDLHRFSLTIQSYFH